MASRHEYGCDCEHRHHNGHGHHEKQRNYQKLYKYVHVTETTSKKDRDDIRRDLASLDVTFVITDISRHGRKLCIWMFQIGCKDIKKHGIKNLPPRTKGFARLYESSFPLEDHKRLPKILGLPTEDVGDEFHRPCKVKPLKFRFNVGDIISQWTPSANTELVMSDFYEHASKEMDTNIQKRFRTFSFDDQDLISECYGTC